WMFLIEGLPAILLGGAVYLTLSDHPHDAKWLRGEERVWLLETLERERVTESPLAGSDLWKVIISPRIWLLSMIYFGVSTTMYGITLWLPSVIQTISGLNYFWTGAVAVLPFLVTVLVMVAVGARSDKRGERRWHTAIPAFLAAAGLIVAGYGTSTVVVVAGIGVGL